MENLIFTSDASKLETELTPEIQKAFSMVRLVSNLTGKRSQIQPARKALEFVSLIPSPRVTEFRAMIEVIAKNAPDLPIDAYVCVLLGSMARRDQHFAVIGGSLAWGTVLHGRVIDSMYLIDKMLPDGYPTEQYLDELVGYYDERPDQLWPSGASVGQLATVEGYA